LRSPELGELDALSYRGYGKEATLFTV
jgi:hypothetical protein